MAKLLIFWLFFNGMLLSFYGWQYHLNELQTKTQLKPLKTMCSWHICVREQHSIQMGKNLIFKVENKYGNNLFPLISDA